MSHKKEEVGVGVGSNEQGRVVNGCRIETGDFLRCSVAADRDQTEKKRGKEEKSLL